MIQLYTGFPELYGGITPDSKEGHNWVEFDPWAHLLVRHATKIARSRVPENGCLWAIFRQDSIAVKIKKAQYGERPSP